MMHFMRKAHIAEITDITMPITDQCASSYENVAMEEKCNFLDSFNG